ncbi:hypothetical protein DUNSADRAFT_6759 [Dunaliella salina]|uniref:Uncharacterized protein n=1 Tax=Dunaliella salina TaxID=3046 RepID=A0ABQ7H6M2_DUNSA|nr:hypothetical protein DUNSADRAFT_6759 [Dunaliella salina]|eukprot:KAF5842515.1 hypothetical protein DUNSADRAFT_6759 [Dunaliella salina]
MNGTKEFVNSAYNGDAEANVHIAGSGSYPPRDSSAPFEGGHGSGAPKMSPWVIAWITFSTILGIVGLILGAYATAEVESMSNRSEQELINIVSDNVFKANADGFVGKRVTAAGWTEHADLDMARSDGGAVTYNNAVYVFGGLRLDDPSANPPGKILSSLIKYDPTTRQTTPFADMPGPRYRMAYAQLDAKIYVFGGLDRYDTPDADHSDPKSTMVYDIASLVHGVAQQATALVWVKRCEVSPMS